jgi:hypothetical protein
MDPFRDHIRHGTHRTHTTDAAFLFSSRRTECPKCGSRRSFSAIEGYPDKGKCFRCGEFIAPPSDAALRSAMHIPSYQQLFVSMDEVNRSMQYFDTIAMEFCYDTYAREERAAIYEYLGQFTREQAECMAHISVGDHLPCDEFNDLILTLARRFPFAARLVEITRSTTALNDSLIGLADDGATIFWYRDIEGRIVNGKKIYYDRFKRDKLKQLPHYIYSTTHGYGSCLFGEEQLARDHVRADMTPFPERALVYLVESEKTAVIGRYLLPNAIWIASGGSSSLTRSKAAVLQGRRVRILYDNDRAGREGAVKAERVLEQCGVNAKIVSTSDLFGRTDGLGEGFDLADHFDRTTPSVIAPVAWSSQP